MSQSESHPIRNGIIATVAGGVVLGALGLAWPPAKTAFLWCWALLVSIGRWLVTSHPVPGWILLILIAISLLAIASAIARAVRSSPLAPAHLSYIKDMIHGVNWHWSWSGNRIDRLWASCPSCQGQLIYRENPDAFYISNPQVELFCEHCNHVMTRIAGTDHWRVLATVEREILRRIRVKESNNQASAS